MFWGLQAVLLLLQPHFEQIKSWFHKGKGFWKHRDAVFQETCSENLPNVTSVYSGMKTKGPGFHLKVTGAMPRAWLRIYHSRWARTYLFGNNVFPVVIQYWFHLQTFFKGGFIQTVIQTNVDWRQFISEFGFILGKVITHSRKALWNGCKMLVGGRQTALASGH